MPVLWNQAVDAFVALLKKTIRPGDEIVMMPVQATYPGGRVKVKGTIVPVSGTAQLQPGQLVPVLVRQGVPRLAFAHSARRAKPGGIMPRRVLAVEMLFLNGIEIVYNPTSGLYEGEFEGVYFRNDAQVTRLALDLGGSPPVMVRWAQGREDAFVVLSDDWRLHLFQIEGRTPGKGLGAQPPPITKIRMEDPFESNALLAQSTHTSTVTGTTEYFTQRLPEIGPGAESVAMAGSTTQQYEARLVLLTQFGQSVPSFLVRDLVLTDALELVAVGRVERTQSEITAAGGTRLVRDAATGAMVNRYGSDDEAGDDLFRREAEFEGALNLTTGAALWRTLPASWMTSTAREMHRFESYQVVLGGVTQERQWWDVQAGTYWHESFLDPDHPDVMLVALGDVGFSSFQRGLFGSLVFELFSRPGLTTIDRGPARLGLPGWPPEDLTAAWQPVTAVSIPTVPTPAPSGPWRATLRYHKGTGGPPRPQVTLTIEERAVAQTTPQTRRMKGYVAGLLLIDGTVGFSNGGEWTFGALDLAAGTWHVCLPPRVLPSAGFTGVLVLGATRQHVWWLLQIDARNAPGAAIFAELWLSDLDSGENRRVWSGTSADVHAAILDRRLMLIAPDVMYLAGPAGSEAFIDAWDAEGRPTLDATAAGFPPPRADLAGKGQLAALPDGVVIAWPRYDRLPVSPTLVPTPDTWERLLLQFAGPSVQAIGLEER